MAERTRKPTKAQRFAAALFDLQNDLETAGRAAEEAIDVCPRSTLRRELEDIESTIEEASGRLEDVMEAANG